jgi:hypothetical protein
MFATVYDNHTAEHNRYSAVYKHTTRHDNRNYSFRADRDYYYRDYGYYGCGNNYTSSR